MVLLLILKSLKNKNNSLIHPGKMLQLPSCNFIIIIIIIVTIIVITIITIKCTQEIGEQETREPLDVACLL